MPDVQAAGRGRGQPPDRAGCFEVGILGLSHHLPAPDQRFDWSPTDGSGLIER